MSLCADSQVLTFNGVRDTEVLPDQLIVSSEIWLTNTGNEPYVILYITGLNLLAGVTYTINFPTDPDISIGTITMWGLTGGEAGVKDPGFAPFGYPNTTTIIPDGSFTFTPSVNIDTLEFSQVSNVEEYNQIVTVTGEAEVGEELTLNITRFCIDGSSTYSVETYDTRVDTEFTFAPTSDGSYRVEYEGSISGVLEVDNVLVKTKANKNIGHVACVDTKKISCNECLSDEYMHKKALSAMADSLFNCERFCQAETKLSEIITFNDCGKKLSDCGCN